MDPKTEPNDVGVASSTEPNAAAVLPVGVTSPAAVAATSPATATPSMTTPLVATSPAAETTPKAQDDKVQVKAEDSSPDEQASTASAATAILPNGDCSQNATPPMQPKTSDAAKTLPAAAPAAVSQLVSLDIGEVRMKLERLFDSWEGKGPNAATASWAEIDALCVFVGRAAEEDDSAAERIQ